MKLCGNYLFTPNGPRCGPVCCAIQCSFVSNLLKEYSADAIRVVLQSHHYREPWECFPSDLASATETVERFQQVRTLIGHDATGEDSMLQERVKAAMDNDMDTPEALLLLREATDAVLATHDQNTGAEILRLTIMLGLPEAGPSVATILVRRRRLIAALPAVVTAPAARVSAASACRGKAVAAADPRRCR